MKIKVCGMNDKNNIREIGSLKPDYMGFIFYPASPRYVKGSAEELGLDELGDSILKVGVFVNEEAGGVRRRYDEYGLDLVQLHGEETPDFCKKLEEEGIPVSKGFQVSPEFDFSRLRDYESSCSYFLFDSKSDGYGGSGRTFNWEILKGYDLSLPVFLSGGIDEGIIDHWDMISRLDLFALDINSRFEVAPGEKDVSRISEFINHVRS